MVNIRTLQQYIQFEDEEKRLNTLTLEFQKMKTGKKTEKKNRTLVSQI